MHILLRAVIAFTTASISCAVSPQLSVRRRAAGQLARVYIASHLQEHRVWASSALATFGTESMWEVAVGVKAPASSRFLREAVPFKEFTLRQHSVVLLTAVEQVIVGLAWKHYEHKRA